MEQFQTVVAEEYKFEKGAKFEKKPFLESSECEDTDSTNTNRQFYLQKPLHNGKFFDADNDGKGKARSFSEKEFEYREQLKIKCFLRTFRTIRMLMQERKTEILSWRFVYICCVSDWDFDAENQTGGGSELKAWKSSENKVSSTFWKFWTNSNPMPG